MARYLVEVYAPASRGVADAAARARAAAESMAAEGAPIRHLQAIHVPEDETCFHLFEGPSPEAIREVSHRASLAFVRITEAVESHPTRQGRAGVLSRHEADAGGS